MVKKYFVQQAGMLVVVAIMMVLTNIIGYKMELLDSILGVVMLCAIGLVGLTISKAMSRFVKLPSMMYVSLLALLLASPISPISQTVISLSNNVAFLAAGTTMGVFAGFNLSRDLKEFAKMGWRFIIITVFVIIGTFIGSAAIAHLVLNATGVI